MSGIPVTKQTVRRSNGHCADMVELCLDVFEGRRTSRGMRESERNEIATAARQVIDRLRASAEGGVA